MLAHVLHQARFDLRSFRRNRQARVTTVLMPVVLLVVIVGMAGSGATVRVGAHRIAVGTYFVPGLIAFGVMAACFLNLVIELVALRESGVLKRRRATPISAAALIAGRTLVAALTSLAVSAVLLVAGHRLYDVPVPVAGVPAVVVTVVVAAAAFAALAYALSAVIRSAAAAQPVVQLVALPLYILSGVLVPQAKLPRWLDDAARFFPLQHLASALRHALDPAAGGLRLSPGDLAVIAAWGVVGALVAVRGFSWVPVGGA